MPRQALGKGLEALLGSIDRGAEVRELPLEEILPNPFQPRLHFDEEGLQELADSIREQGLLQPVTVRRMEDGGYQLIAGERRWRAAGMARLATIPAIIRNTQDDANALELALVENLQRRDLSPVESAHAYQRLITEFSLTQEQVAKRVGKQRSGVANVLRLLNLPLEVQDHVQAGRVSLGHAKVLLGAPGSSLQKQLATRAIVDQLSVRQLERLVARMRPQPAASPAPTPPPSETRALALKLGKQLGTSVAFHEGKKGGRIELHYKSREERDRLVALLIEGSSR